MFFLDDAHFVLGAWLGYLWCLIRILLPTPSGRQRFTVLGALHAITQEILTVTTDTYIKSPRVVELFTPLAARFTDLPIRRLGQCPLPAQSLRHGRGGTPGDYLALAAHLFPESQSH